VSTDRRPRRSTPEVQRLILEAARAVFAAQGFGGATTNAIAQRADVSERVLFRHFPTKETLYEVAVVAPFKSFVREFAQRWDTVPLDDLEAEGLFRLFATELYDIARENRDLVQAFLQRSEPAMASEFRRLDAVADRFAATQGQRFDTPVSVRLLFLFIISAARYEDLLFHDQPEITRERIVHELGEIVLRHATWASRTPSS